MKIYTFLLVLCVCVSMTACVVYNPQVADVPLIHEKNDLRFDGGIAVLHPGLNATVSYGLTNALAVQVYGNLAPDREYFTQGALGYYKNFNHSTVLEIYGGFGYGYGYFFDGSTGGNMHGNYQLPFTQINFGKIGNEASNLEYGLGFKTGFLNTGMTDNRFYDTEGRDYNINGLLLEPVLLLRPGGKKTKLSLKLSRAWFLQNNYKENPLPYARFNFGIGLNLR